MNKDNETIATEVLKLLKKEYNKAIRRLYGLLVIIICLFIASVIDSIYQRCRIIKIIEKYEKNCIQEIDEIQREIGYAEVKFY